MKTSSLRWLGITLLLLMTVAAWAENDCLMFASSAVLAYRLFLLHMDRGAPWSGLDAALQALTAGLLAAMAGITLVFGVALAWLGWWQVAPLHAPLFWPLPLAAATLCCLAQGSRAGLADELRLWLVVLAGLLLAAHAHDNGWALAPCVFVTATGGVMSWAGWRLASSTVSDMLRSCGESRPPPMRRQGR